MTTIEKVWTLAELIASEGLTMTVTPTDHNPNMDGSSDRMDHWRCVLRTAQYPRRRMTVVFSMGSGHNGQEPELAAVLDCLASDASTLESSFEDWCADFGYDPDSRKHERTYRTIEKQAAKLRRFLNGPMDDDVYDTLLYHTERL